MKPRKGGGDESSIESKCTTSQNGELKVVDEGVPPAIVFEKMMKAQTIVVPSAAEMLSLQAKRSLTPSDLPKLYADAAEALSRASEPRLAEESCYWRAAIARAEAGHLPPLPSGNRGLALLALEAVANAISCWNLKWQGEPLSAYSGTIYTERGGLGARLRVRWPDGSKNPVGPPAEIWIWLECDLLIWAPSWFYEARRLPMPFTQEAVEKCAKVAGVALREYLWLMRGWNRKLSRCPEPVGGNDVKELLKITEGALERDELGERRQTRGGPVEQIHKAASKEFPRIDGIIPERYPFELFTVLSPAQRLP